MLEGGAYLRRSDSAQVGADELEAVALVLGICDEQRLQGDASTAGLVARIARCGALDQDRRGTCTDARTGGVRAMTIHASKGLFFEAVHVAGLAAGRMPLGRRTCRPGRSDAAMRRDWDDEIALFALAMTRARRHLHLSRAERYRRDAERSPFLVELGPLVVERRVGIDGLRTRGGA